MGIRRRETDLGAHARRDSESAGAGEIAGQETHVLSITVTIAVPTHNRARLLGGTLASIAALKYSGRVNPECLIVDNNSPDDTRDKVEVFARTAPIAVRYVVEPQLGSSYARNRAIAEARGEYIFFIDDDALAEPDWAIELLAEMERRHLDAACGMVLPELGTAASAMAGA